MRSHDLREVLLGEDAADLMSHLVQAASEVASAPIAMLTVNAGPTVLIRAHRGLPDALELSCGLNGEDWPLLFGSASDSPIVNERGFGLEAEPGTAASMLGDFATVAVPIHFGDECTGALAVIDPRPREFAPDLAVKLRELWGRALQFVRERARCSAILELRDAPCDEGSVLVAIDRAVKEARCSYHRMRISATLARWHVAGHLPRTEEFCRVVEEALLAAAELARSTKDLLRWSRRLDLNASEAAAFAAAVGDADLVEPAFRPGLRVVQAAKAQVRAPSLWTSSLAALPMAAELDPWGTSTLSRLVQSSESLLKVRTSPPAA